MACGAPGRTKPGQQLQPSPSPSPPSPCLQTYHLQAASPQEARSWVEALQAAVAAARARGASTDEALTPRPAPRGAPALQQQGSVRLRSPLAAGSPSPQHPQRRRNGAEAAVPASPLGARRSRSLGQDAHPQEALLPPLGSGALHPGSGTGTPTTAPPPAHRMRRSFTHSVADALAAPSPTASVKSAGSDLWADREGGARSFAAAAAYDGSVRSLSSGRPPMRVLMEGLGAGLAGESLREQYERARAFVRSHEADFSPEQLDILQGWEAIAANGGSAGAAAATAARAMYILSLPPGWSSWSEYNALYVR